MNMIIVSNISVWIILIITIFKLNRDRRKSNSNIEKIEKLINENHIKLAEISSYWFFNFFMYNLRSFHGH